MGKAVVETYRDGIAFQRLVELAPDAREVRAAVVLVLVEGVEIESHRSEKRNCGEIIDGLKRDPDFVGRVLGKARYLEYQARAGALWSTLDHEERQKIRRAFNHGPACEEFESVAVYALHLADRGLLEEILPERKQEEPLGLNVAEAGFGL